MLSLYIYIIYTYYTSTAASDHLPGKLFLLSQPLSYTYHPQRAAEIRLRLPGDNMVNQLGSIESLAHVTIGYSFLRISLRDLPRCLVRAAVLKWTLKTVTIHHKAVTAEHERVTAEYELLTTSARAQNRSHQNSSRYRELVKKRAVHSKCNQCHSLAARRQKA